MFFIEILVFMLCLYFVTECVAIPLFKIIRPAMGFIFHYIIYGIILSIALSFITFMGGLVFGKA